MKPFALFFILFVAISSTRLLFDGSPIKFSFKKIIMSVVNVNLWAEQQVKYVDEVEYRTAEISNTINTLIAGQVSQYLFNSQKIQDSQDSQVTDSNFSQNRNFYVQYQDIIRRQIYYYVTASNFYSICSISIDEFLVIQEEIALRQANLVLLSEHMNQMLKIPIKIQKSHQLIRFMNSFPYLILNDQQTYQVLSEQFQTIQINYRKKIQEDFQTAASAEQASFQAQNVEKFKLESLTRHKSKQKNTFQYQIYQLDQFFVFQQDCFFWNIKKDRTQRLLHSTSSFSNAAREEQNSVFSQTAEQQELLMIIEDSSILVKKMIVKGIKSLLNKLKEKTRDLLQKAFHTTKNILEKVKNYVDNIQLIAIMGANAQQLPVNKSFQSLTHRNLNNLQTQGGQRTLQIQFNLIYPFSKIKTESQFRFQFDKFGEGYSNQIENVKEINGTHQIDLEKTLPDWLYFDKDSRVFRGKVPKKKDYQSYEITIKFSWENYQITDKFLFEIYDNIGIFALELVGSYNPGWSRGQLLAVSTMQIKGKSYALIANTELGLQIIDVSDPLKPTPTLIGQEQEYSAYGVSTMYIGEKLCALIAAGSFGLKIIEVSDPSKLSLIGSLAFDGEIASDVSTMIIAGKLYALLIMKYHLRIIEVSDPYNPLLISQQKTTHEWLYWAVCTMEIEEKFYLLIADGWQGLKIIEVSDPSKPVQISQLNIGLMAIVISTIKIGRKNYAYIAAKNDGIIMIEVSDPYNPKQLSYLYTSQNIYMRISWLEMGGYTYALIANYDAGLTIIDVSDPSDQVPVISLDTNGQAMGVTCMEKEGKFLALVANNYAGLKILDIKVSNKYRNYFYPLLSQRYEYYNNVNWISTMKINEKLHALIATGGQGLQIYEVNSPSNLVFKSSTATILGLAISTMEIDDKPYALIGVQNGLKIIEVSDPSYPAIRGSFSFDGYSNGISTVEIREKFYALIANGNNGLQIIDVSDPSNPKPVSSLYIKGHAYGIIIMEQFGKCYALIANTYEGLQIIEVSDPLNPIQKGSFHTSALEIINMEIGLKLYVLIASGDNGLQIVEVSDPTNPVLVGNISINGHAIGIRCMEIANKLYAYIVDKQQGIKIFDVTNPSRPTLSCSQDNLNSYIYKYSRALSWYKYRGELYLLSANEGVFLQDVFESKNYLNIVQITQSKALYPQITSSIKNQLREFSIKLFPINTNTLYAIPEEIQLLSLQSTIREKKVLSSFPYWVETNLDEKTINVQVPLSKDSLELLRYTYYIFSTKVNPIDLKNLSGEKNSHELITELIKTGYLDTNLFPTISFNVQKDLLIDSYYNQLKIKEVLSFYIHVGYFQMTMDDFLELTNSPIIKEGVLQNQFDKRVENPYVTKKIDFQFDDNSFTHPDGDPLTYSITLTEKRDAYGTLCMDIYGQSNLSQWLNFDRGTRRFQGTPTIDDEGVYTITVQASNKYKEVSQDFTIVLISKPPTIGDKIPEEFKSLKLGQTYNYEFSEKLFLHNESLNYKAYIIYKPQGSNKKKTLQLRSKGDFWLNFDDQQKLFTGKPNSTDISNNSEGYNQTFTIRITATDIARKYVSQEFNLTVTKLFPKLNNNLTIQDQFDNEMNYKNIVLKVGRKLDFTFSDRSFLAEDKLNYELKIQYEIWTNLPRDHWLRFDEQNRKIYGTPKKEDIGKYKLKVIASDLYDQIESIFVFEITKKIPSLKNPIQNTVKPFIINEYFEFQFDLNTFEDEEKDLLTYRAELAEGRILPDWLSFKEGDRKLVGKPQNIQDLKIRIIATNIGEESMQDEFEITVIPSFQYIIEIIVEFGGPLLTLYGLLRQRALLYDLFCKNRYQYRRYEEAIEGQEYFKQINLIKEDIEKGKELWDRLKEQTIEQLTSDILIQNKSIKEIRMIKNNWFEQAYMNAEGEVDKLKIVAKLNQTFLTGKKMLKTMVDQDALIDGIVANYLFEKDKYTKKIYEQLKQDESYFLNEKKKKIYSHKDWYKKYIITSQKNNELEYIKINDEILNKKLSLMNIKDNLNKQLLKNKILSHTRGIDSIQRLSPSKGENIHAYENDIKLIKAKQKIVKTFGIGLKLRIFKKLKFLKLNYVDINMIDNNKLPNWLSAEIIENKLYFSGVPQKQDKGEIMIQIIDDGDFMLKEFHIRVFEKDEMRFNLQEINSDKSNRLQSSSNLKSKNNEKPSDIKIRLSELNSNIIKEIELNEIKINTDKKREKYFV